MTSTTDQASAAIATLEAFADRASYTLVDSLNRDPDANPEGIDHEPRQVFSGHYVPVKPTPLENPEYVTHSQQFFTELGLAPSLAESEGFVRLFSGDLSQVPEPLRAQGWACGYALSIFGTEYTQQCPFGTGNGYGDGRAISVLEVDLQGKHWEMQLKGAGRTPYCRGGDGRAVLRSSLREFLAQELMHALGVPTSRSLSLYVSKTEKVRRPWYSQGSRSLDPDRMQLESTAIATRVAPSFIRVGQLELFARRARNPAAHPAAKEELAQLVLHLIEREYSQEIAASLPYEEKLLELARQFLERLTSLIAHWIRVGYCQGNFNSDNCAAGGFTLDYGPFGFCEVFDPYYQPWTGGGRHFAFFNQPAAAARNFMMFCQALKPLLVSDAEAVQTLNEIQSQFAPVMQEKLEKMWAAKLGLKHLDTQLYQELIQLMQQTPVDYTLFFRELASLPTTIEPLKKSFYTQGQPEKALQEQEARWSNWLERWRESLTSNGAAASLDEIAALMQATNPKYILRERFLAAAYQQANQGHYAQVHELQEIMAQPYAELSQAIEEHYYQRKPYEHFGLGGLSHYSCSS